MTGDGQTSRGRYTFTIPGYSPPRPNELFRQRLRGRMVMERTAKELVWAYGRWIPEATGKRRVSMMITLGPRQRVPDADADPWKVILDALANWKMILGDRRDQVELVPVVYDRGLE